MNLKDYKRVKDSYYINEDEIRDKLKSLINLIMNEFALLIYTLKLFLDGFYKNIIITIEDKRNRILIENNILLLTKCFISQKNFLFIENVKYEKIRKLLRRLVDDFIERIKNK